MPQDEGLTLTRTSKTTQVAAMAASNGQKKLLTAQKHTSLNNSESLPAIDASHPSLPFQLCSAAQHQMANSSNNDVYQVEVENVQNLNEAVRILHVDDNDNPGKGCSRGRNATNGTLRAEAAIEDDQAHLSNSPTKPASLDGKSVASGTTFALDEKESLRPDDSASVKAAEEEESFSGPASGAASSRVGSEAGSRAFRDQFYEITERMGPSMHRGAATNRFGVPGIQEEDPQGVAASTNPSVPDISPGDGAFRGIATPYGFAQQSPDEKLLEALESPKDRLFLLKLEQDVISFVRDSKDPILDLPPCNSFCRLLAHKLADYYYLTHFVDNAVSAVRLYRTPFCRLPAPLTAISNPSTTGNTPPPNPPAVKIMRRAGVGRAKRNLTIDGSTAASFMDPSKATSDIGGESGSEEGRNRVHSPTESMIAKDKAAMTREEREAKYKEARERIFKGFDEPDNADSNSGLEEIKEISRSSSTSGRKKTKKQRSAQDDGFEARSQFNAYYPTMQYMTPGFAGPGEDTSFYNPYPLPSTNINGQTASLNSRPGQQLSPPHQQISAFMPQFQTGLQQPYSAGSTSLYGHGCADPALSGYDHALRNQYNQVPQQSSMATQRSSAVSSPAMNNFAQPIASQTQHSTQQWSQSYYESPYQALGQHYHPPVSQLQHYHNATNTPSSIPYPYGQLPSQSFQSGRQTYQNQHPLPGSFNRLSFNPKTQAFIPGFLGNQTGPYGPQPYPLNTDSQGLSHMPINQASSNTRRQGLPIHGSTSFTLPQPAHANGSKPCANHAGTTRLPQVHPSGQSSLSKWGTPSHLPPKPPPPQMPNFVDSQRSLPANVYATVAPQAYGQNTHSIQPGLSATGCRSSFTGPSASIKMA
ncbi:MAG: hypothetical protein M1830_005871 [Pleopsidium flavum]|nr:MAG: hypothetical protein M1830_005871 [Pleopsidium flavum]